MELSDYDDVSISPQVEDTITAVRVASFVSFLAGLAFFASPWTFGRWMDTGAWNCRFIGGLAMALAGARLLWPLSYRMFSFANACFGLWIAFSPWIFSYGEHGGRVANSLTLGLALLTCSLISTRVEGMEGTPLDQFTPEAHRLVGDGTDEQYLKRKGAAL